MNTSTIRANGPAAILLAAATGLSLMTAPLSASASSSPLELVSLRSAQASISELQSAVRSVGGTIVDTFEIAGAALVRIPAGSVLPDSLLLLPNSTMKFQGMPAAVKGPSGYNYRDTIAAGDATGAGVTVAIVDTGVANVPGITVSARVNVSGGATGDGVGHGTFMAGLAAGNGAYPGVAPGASIFDVQVADATGATDLARVLAGLDAVATRAATNPSIKVVNLSLASGSPLPPAVDPLTRALDRLWRRGITVVVPSGNDGPGTVSSPGVDQTLLTVGAIDEADSANRGDDSVATFSGYGNKYGQKPDVVAPGVSLVSLRAPGSDADVNYPSARVGDSYFRGSGTSMATAVVSGAAAVLAAERGLTPDMIKGVLISTAYLNKTLTAGDGEGAGAIDLGAARTAAAAAYTVPTPAETAYSPLNADAAAWSQFANSWANDDLAGVAAAWRQLSPQSRRWAANAWALSVATDNLASANFDAFDTEGRNWATADFAGRNWASDDWAGRNWAANGYWNGRNWAAVDGAWAGRNWADSFWTGRNWADTSWNGRNWAAGDWLARAWVGRNWAGRNWANDAWAGRNWSGRNWAAADWSAMTLAGRNWATSGWTGRNWAGFVK